MNWHGPQNNDCGCCPTNEGCLGVTGDWEVVNGTWELVEPSSSINGRKCTSESGLIKFTPSSGIDVDERSGLQFEFYLEETGTVPINAVFGAIFDADSTLENGHRILVSIVNSVLSLTIQRITSGSYEDIITFPYSFDYSTLYRVVSIGELGPYLWINLHTSSVVIGSNTASGLNALRPLDGSYQKLGGKHFGYFVESYDTPSVTFNYSVNFPFSRVECLSPYVAIQNLTTGGGFDEKFPVQELTYHAKFEFVNDGTVTLNYENTWIEDANHGYYQLIQTPEFWYGPWDITAVPQSIGDPIISSGSNAPLFGNEATVGGGNVGVFLTEIELEDQQNAGLTLHTPFNEWPTGGEWRIRLGVKLLEDCAGNLCSKTDWLHNYNELDQKFSVGLNKYRIPKRLWRVIAGFRRYWSPVPWGDPSEAYTAPRPSWDYEYIAYYKSPIAYTYDELKSGKSVFCQLVQDKEIDNSSESRGRPISLSNMVKITFTKSPLYNVMPNYHSETGTA